MCTATTLRVAHKTLDIGAWAACTGQMGSATRGLELTICWRDLRLPCQRVVVLQAQQPVQVQVCERSCLKSGLLLDRAHNLPCAAVNTQL